MSDADSLVAKNFAKLSQELKEAKAEIERLALDVKILSEELERERRPKRDER